MNMGTVSYLMAGKRFVVDDVAGLDMHLKQYNLTTNPDRDEFDNITVRRLADPKGTKRFITKPTGGLEKEIDISVGSIIVQTGLTDHISEITSAEIERALSHVQRDIPDANILLFAYYE